MSRFLLWVRVGWAALTTRSMERFYDRIAPYYERAFRRHGIHAEKMADTLAACNPGGFILDLGCGTGVLARSLKGKGLSPVGIDLSFASLVELTERDPDMTVVQAEAQRLPFADQSIASVGCLGVWRHFEDPKQVARELTRVLVPDGALIIGYFPPAMGGAFHLGLGFVSRIVAVVYGGLTSMLGYVDRIDRAHEDETRTALRQVFRSVSSIQSGRRWHLLFARGPIASGERTAGWQGRVPH